MSEERTHILLLACPPSPSPPSLYGRRSLRYGGLLLREGTEAGFLWCVDMTLKVVTVMAKLGVLVCGDTEMWAPGGDMRIPVGCVCVAGLRGAGDSEHVHADLSVALGTCESSHLDTVGSRGDCPCGCHGGTVSEHMDPMGEGAELHHGSGGRDKFGSSSGQSEGKMRCREQKAGIQEINGGSISCVQCPVH